MKSRIDVVGQNGNDGLHYELDKLKPEYSDEFWNWYRFFLQSPRMCSLQYDDEKMWEAWRAGYKLGRDNAYKRKDCPPEVFTIPKEKHVHTMNKEEK